MYFIVMLFIIILLQYLIIFLFLNLGVFLLLRYNHENSLIKQIYSFLFMLQNALILLINIIILFINSFMYIYFDYHYSIIIIDCYDFSYLMLTTNLVEMYLVIVKIVINLHQVLIIV